MIPFCREANMSSEQAQPATTLPPGQSKSIIQHMMKMPLWHQGLLTVAVVALGGGLVGQGMGYFSKPEPQPNTVQTTAAPGGHSSFVGDGAPTGTSSTDSSPAPQEEPTLVQQYSPQLTRV